MFTPLKFMLPDKIKKLGIKKQVEVVDVCKRSEGVINEKIGPIFKVKVLQYKNDTLFVRTGNSTNLGKYFPKHPYRDMWIRAKLKGD